MASKSLGTLTLDLVARIGGFTAGLDKAEKEARKRAKAIEEAFDSAAKGIGVAFGAMATAGVAAFAILQDGLQQAASFQDLAEMTGASAEGLAGFAVAASTAGVSMDSIASASIKLTKNLVEVDDESKAAGAALKSLGLNIADFKKLDPVAQYEAVSKALAGYADGAGKTAIAVALFGKAGAEQLKVMKALEEQGGRTNILTQEQISLADDVLDRQAKLRAELGLYAGAIATQFIEPTNILLKLLKEAAAEFVNTSGSVTQLGVNTGVQAFAESAGRALAGVIDYIKTTKTEFGVLTDFIGSSVEAVKKYGSFDFAGGRKVGEDFRARYGLDDFGRKVIADGAKEGAKTFTQKFDEELSRGRAERNRALLNAVNYGTGKDNRPTLRPPITTSGGGSKDDPTKKLLENELATIKAAGEAAKDLLADRNRVLDLYNSQGLLSVSNYYSALQANLDEATAAQAKSYDDQIAALKKFQAAASKQTDVADAQGKINKLEEDKAKLYRQSGTAALESSIKQVQAQKAVKDAFDEVNAKVLEYQGNLRAAGEIRFDAANEKLIAQAKAEQNEQVIKQIELLKQYTLAQADINKLQSQFSLAQGDLQIAEERITIARERGTMGEIESLKKSGEARKEAVAIMERQLAAFQAIDAAARSPEQAQAIERLKVQLEGLKATVDPLADKFNTLFADSAGSALSDFINGTKTAKEAFKSFTDSIFKELVNLAAKEVFKSFFGKGGSATGGNGLDIGGLLSSFFGGGSSGSKGSSGGGGFGSLFSMFGFASGGFTGVGAANDPAGIVHKGEYVLTAEQTKRIGVANLDRGNFGGGNVFNINVPESVNRSTGTQIAAEAQRKLAQGRRNT
jgi:hypothetical protein